MEILDSNKNKKDLVLVPYLSNHIFRHTFTTRMNEENVNSKAMQTVLGHADITTTFDVYTDSSNEFLISELDKFENAFINSN